MSNPLFRLAPTPSGFLHQGNAFNFLLNWCYARYMGAKVLLRIDDLDAMRSRPEYLEDIFETLHWLGLDWDEGPTDVRDFQENWSQSFRLPNYQQQLERLVEKSLVFACDCSRKTLREAGNIGGYPNVCMKKNLPLDTDLAWRLSVTEGTKVQVQDAKNGEASINLYDKMGSFVIKTREGIPAYQLASLCDDVMLGVTHVIRGADLLDSTAAQLYLANILGYEHFKNIIWVHHPLITDAHGNKLSKSGGSIALQHLRKQAFESAHLLQAFAAWLNIDTSKKISSATDLIPFLPPIFKKL